MRFKICYKDRPEALAELRKLGNIGITVLQNDLVSGQEIDLIDTVDFSETDLVALRNANPHLIEWHKLIWRE